MGDTPHLHPAAPSYLGYVGEPLQDGVDPLKVIWHGDMGNTVVVHDLHSSQLVVGSVNLPSQHLDRVPKGNTWGSADTGAAPLLCLSAQTSAPAHSLWAEVEFPPLPRLILK